MNNQMCPILDSDPDTNPVTSGTITYSLIPAKNMVVARTLFGEQSSTIAMISHFGVPCEVPGVQMQWIIRLPMVPMVGTTSIGPVCLKVFVHRRIWLNTQPALAERIISCPLPVMSEPNLEWVIPAPWMADFKSSWCWPMICEVPVTHEICPPTAGFTI